MMGIHDQEPPPGTKPIPQYYADSVVVAYRRSASDVPVESLHPKMTSSGGSPDLAMLTDGDLEKTTGIPIPAVGEVSWIQYEFPEPQTIRCDHVCHQGPGLDSGDGGRDRCAREDS